MKTKKIKKQTKTKKTQILKNKVGSKKNK